LDSIWPIRDTWSDDRPTDVTTPTLRPGAAPGVALGVLAAPVLAAEAVVGAVECELATGAGWATGRLIGFFFWRFFTRLVQRTTFCLRFVW